MTEHEKQTEQFIELLKNAGTATKECVKKCLILHRDSRGFNATFKEATPPGANHPPVDIIRNLVNEWAEKEGLKC